MIRSVAINGIRGIREGRLDDLAPLTILVGPNGAGKSTVLDALFIAANPNPNQGLQEICQSINRRVSIPRGWRWLVHRASEAESSTIQVTTSSGEDRTCQIRLLQGGHGVECRPVTAGITVGAAPVPAVSTVSSHIGGLRRPSAPGRFKPLNDVTEIRFLEADLFGMQSPLHELYSRVVERGRRQQANDLLAEVVSGAKGVEILTEDDSPIIHLVFEDHSVPAALAGDGVLMVLRLIVELASRRGGVVLLEEPEVHQHPGAIRQSAKAILAAVRREIQVILTTHSLELIDALLAESSEDDLDKMAVYRLHLDSTGLLESHRIPGREVLVARTQIEDDLR